ncbi:hypothetical protein [Eudoraea chungangensis]|uniref:hypothetical protein n=1 Tax=Eudoraea chungangensis TaxID=1481905 RepID=UPI0023ECF2E0|nr:hypothetical protein [Eudoraea chungangensis]
MLAVLTGDIVNSEKTGTEKWMPLLKDYLRKVGESSRNWEIYRGDEFQLSTSPELALETAIGIKALIKTIPYLDVRIGIGLGEEEYQGAGITDSNGSAYRRSGRTLSRLKEEGVNLGISTGNAHEKTLNLLFKLALDFMDSWSVVSAEIILISLQNPNWKQREIVEKLKIKQSAVSQRQKRARLNLVQELLEYYKETVNKSDF